MDGPLILAHALSKVRPKVFADGSRWQYYPQSDHDSKIACWAVAFELLERSSLLRSHVQAGKVVFGVNHPMNDFKTGRKKKLDLVIARPEGSAPQNGRVPQTLETLANKWSIPLTPDQQSRLRALPVAHVAPVGSVLMAMEAKVCMTAHIKSLPRLYDELNSSHLTIHGASSQALAVGLVTVNAAAQFISPGRNKRLAEGLPVVVSPHPPHAIVRTLEKLEEIPRRSGPGQEGFDALGIVLIDLRNDGSPVSVHTDPPAPQPGEVFHYEQMLNRIVHGYEVAFAHI
jgi:hypothetical protein